MSSSNVSSSSFPSNGEQIITRTIKTKWKVKAKDFQDSYSQLQKSYYVWIIVLCILYFSIGIMLLIDTTIFSETRVNGSSAISKQEGHILFWVNMILTIASFIILFILISLMFGIRQPSQINKK